MEYTKGYYELRNRFARMENSTIVDEEIEILHLPFNSDSHWQCILDESIKSSDSQLGLGMPDSHFFENNHFTYPVFVPRSSRKYSKAILLLHGLNERTWDKYLPWAYILAKETQRPVILFPVSFHMNRSPMEWIDPKEMVSLVNYRKQKYGANTLTYANVALSTRLTEDPLRFLKSGHQTAEDLLLLTNQINQGLIPLFEKGTSIDVFAYSIGAFIMQIILLAFPQGEFSGSRIFLFCGGAFFDDMNGISRLIMDKVAFEKLRDYYTSAIDDVLEKKKLLCSLLTEFPLGKAFYTMLSDDNTPEFRAESFDKLANHIHAIALENDSVIPASGIEKFFTYTKPGQTVFETLHFPYQYSHEIPFPVSGKANFHEVDQCFNHIFTKAVEFLA